MKTEKEIPGNEVQEKKESKIQWQSQSAVDLSMSESETESEIGKPLNPAGTNMHEPVEQSGYFHQANDFTLSHFSKTSVDILKKLRD